MKKKITHGLLIGLLATVAALLLQFAGALDGPENATWDWRARWLAAPGPATDRIRVVMIDQTSLDWAKQTLQVPLSWPWPRQLYVPILVALREGGAKSVTIDLLFSEPSFAGVDDDEAFGEAIAAGGNIVGTLTLSDEQGLAREWAPGSETNRLQVEGLDAYLTTERGTRTRKGLASFPIPQLAAGASMLGGIMITGQDRDAIVRRIAPFQLFDGRFVPTLGLASFLGAHPDVALAISGDALMIGPLAVPLDGKGLAILRYRGPSLTHPALNAAAVMQAGLRILEGKPAGIDLSLFRDAYVLLGVTAPGFKDLRPTPLQRDFPGVELHATVLDNLLSGDFIRELSRPAAIAFSLAIALAAGIAIRLLAGGLPVAFAAVAFLAFPLLLGGLFYARNVWFPVALPSAAALFAIVAAAAVNYSLEGRQKRFIKNAFRQYLSPAVIERLLNDPKQLQLGGETRELTLFFSDIEGFSAISERLSPQRLTTLLNEYLTAMTDIIHSEGGTIDKYEGDAIIAFWNAPLDVPDHPLRAVRAALSCGERLSELRPRFRELCGRDLHARIGINTGQVVVGNMGSNQRFDYTFLGDAGNLASRLEGINKQFGTYLMISESTRDRLGDRFATRELSLLRVVGRDKPVRVFEAMSREDQRSRLATLEIFSLALGEFYRGRFREALAGFERISGSDPPARAYAAKCRALIAAPPQSWDGVWTMTEK